MKRTARRRVWPGRGWKATSCCGGGRFVDSPGQPDLRLDRCYGVYLDIVAAYTYKLEEQRYVIVAVKGVADA